MRWKLLRRRLSISAPRMIVRSHLPWPLRWAIVALMFGLLGARWRCGPSSSARTSPASIAACQGGTGASCASRSTQLREEREKALSVANIAESLLKTEKAAQDKLAQQVKAIEAENLALKNDLGFFERLLPAGDAEGLTIRGLQAETDGTAGSCGSSCW